MNTKEARELLAEIYYNETIYKNGWIDFGYFLYKNFEYKNHTISADYNKDRENLIIKIDEEYFMVYGFYDCDNDLSFFEKNTKIVKVKPIEKIVKIIEYEKIEE